MIMVQIFVVHWLVTRNTIFVQHCAIKSELQTTDAQCHCTLFSGFETNLDPWETKPHLWQEIGNIKLSSSLSFLIKGFNQEGWENKGFNFLAMLIMGDRYLWSQVPYALTGSPFTLLHNLIKNGGKRAKILQNSEYNPNRICNYLCRVRWASKSTL